MKTVLIVLVAFILGGVLVYILAPGRKAPMSPPHTPETHQAAVIVQVAGGSSNCKVKTYSPVMAGRPRDNFVWTIVAVGDCADYASADLQIAVKNPSWARDLHITDTTPGPSRQATVPVYPDRCNNLPQPAPCQVPYRVTVTSTDPNRPDLTEDPRIDIWK